VAASRHNLGSLLRERGDVAAARPHLEDAVRSLEAALATAAADAAAEAAAAVPAADAADAGRGAASPAAGPARRALAAAELRLANGRNSLALLLKSGGEFAGARALLLKAGAVRIGQLGMAHPDSAATLHSLAELADAMGEPDRAAAIRRDLLRALREAGVTPDDATGDVTAAPGGLDAGAPPRAQGSGGE
jgi:tetratricopeptide (TPR) repeat protein